MQKETEMRKSRGTAGSGERAGLSPLVNDTLLPQKLLRHLIFAGLGGLFCSAELLFGARPFGLALVGAAGEYMPGAALGVAFFALLVGDYYTLGGLFGLLALRALLSALERRERPETAFFAERRLFRVTAVGVTAFLLGALRLVGQSYLYYDLFALLALTLAAPLATALYMGAGEGGDSLTLEGQDLSVAALILTGIFALRGVSLFGIAPGAVAAALCAFLLVAHRGLWIGAVGGLVLGLCYDPILAPAFLLCGLAFGLLEKSSRGGGVLAGGAAGAAYAFLVGKTAGLVALLPALFSAGALFLAGDSAGLVEGAPARHLAVARRRAALQSAAAASAVAGGIERGEIADALQDLSGSLFELAGRTRRPGTEALSGLAVRCLSATCEECPHREQCREGVGGIEPETVSKIVQSLLREGAVGEAHFSAFFGGACPHTVQMAGVINREALSLAQDALRGDGTGVVAGDYAAMSRLLAAAEGKRQSDFRCDAALGERLMQRLQRSGYQLESAAVCGETHRQVILRGIRLPGRHIKLRELRGITERVCRFSLGEPTVTDGEGLFDVTFPEAMRLHGLSVKSTRPGGQGERYCGDSAAIFSGQGMDHSLLCDGMGSGKEAALVSTIATVFLSRFLRAGIDTETAIDLLNGFLATRSAGGREASTTVDLLTVDRVRGEARLFKCGAAPTYLLRDGRVTPFFSPTAPVGILERPDIGMLELALLPGDLLVQVSDGFTDSDGGCPFLAEMLQNEWDGDPQSFVRHAINRAAAHGRDDLSLILTLIKEGAPETVK